MNVIRRSSKNTELDHWTDKQETKAEVDTLIGKIFQITQKPFEIEIRQYDGSYKAW